MKDKLNITLNDIFLELNEARYCASCGDVDMTDEILADIQETVKTLIKE